MPSKNAIGAIDGTHIEATIADDAQDRYKGHKHTVTFNVLAVVDFDMLFTYAMVGWEGSAHDPKILDSATNDEHMKFPHPPRGKYYLCDKGYACRDRYMVPYSRTNYHLSQFHGVPPGNRREAFNSIHS